MGKLKAEIRKTGDGGPGSADVIVGRCERIDSNPVPRQQDVRRNVRSRDRGQRPQLQKQKKKKPCLQATGPGLPSAGDHDSTY